MKNNLKSVLISVGVIALVVAMYTLGASSSTPSNTVSQPTHMMDNGTSMPGMRHGQ